MKLNIGCGRDYRVGWVNTDISKGCKADVYMDIGKDRVRVPTNIQHNEWRDVKDGEVEEIYVSGVLEQIQENDHFVFAMYECWRVLKDGGIMTVIVPNARYAIAHQDPMDVRKFTRETFPYFQKGARQWELYGSIYGFKPWSEIRIEENERHIMTVTMIK